MKKNVLHLLADDLELVPRDQDRLGDYLGRAVGEAFDAELAKLEARLNAEARMDAIDRERE